MRLSSLIARLASTRRLASARTTILAVAGAVALPATSAAEEPGPPMESTASPGADDAQPIDWAWDATSGVLEGTRAGAAFGSHQLHPGAPNFANCEPITWDAHIFVVAGAQLRVVDTASGVVVGRVHLDGVCERFDTSVEPPRLVTRAAEPGVDWSRSWTLSVEEGLTELPTPTLLLDGTTLPERAARHVLGEGAQPSLATWSADPVVDPEHRERIAAAVPVLARRVELDPDDPWHAWYLAQAHLALGEPDRAARALDRLRDAAPSFDLVRVSARLFEADPELSDLLFDRGMAWMRARGYQPEAALTAYGVVVALGMLPRYDELSRPDRQRLAHRIATLAPRAEGIAAFWQHHAEAARRDGEATVARSAELHAERAHATRTLTGFTDTILPIDLRLFLLTALLLAVPLLFALHLGRALRQRPWTRGTRASRFVPSTWIPRGVLVGLVLLGLGAVLVSRSAVQDVRAIGYTASAPLDTLSGFPHHPSSLAWWSHHATDTAEGDQWRSLLASTPPPDDAALSDALLDALRATGRSEPVALDAHRSLFHLGEFLSLPTTTGPTASHLLPPLVAFLLLLAVLGIVLPREREPSDTRERGPRSARWLDWVVPGSSPALGALGPPLFAALLWGLVAGAWHLSTGGSSWGPLDEISHPAVDRYYGLGPGPETTSE